VNADTAGLRVPKKVSNLPGDSETAAEAFQARMNEYRESPQETPPQGEYVPVDAIEDLLDDLQMREQDGTAFVTAARMLEETICWRELHRCLYILCLCL
jgi:hypothetical protein